jgi:uncharacterized protein YbjT (DUF2867 family)
LPKHAQTPKGILVILIIGGNGRIGREVVHELSAAGESFRLMVRDTKTAIDRFGGQVDVLEGDLNNQASIRAAMEGCNGVFLCSPVDPEQVKQQNAVVDAAVINNLYVVKLSGLATYAGSFVDSGRWHAETESHLVNSGTPFTCLHPYFFMQNMDFQIQRVKETGVLSSAVSEAAIAMVDVRDIAAVAAKLLCNPSLAKGQTLPMTCDTALSYPEMAEIMSEVFQHPVSFKVQTEEEVKANLKKSGLPEWHTRIILQFNRAFEQGLGKTPHPAVRDILQRDSISFERYIRDSEPNNEDSNPFPS